MRVHVVFINNFYFPMCTNCFERKIPMPDFEIESDTIHYSFILFN